MDNFIIFLFILTLSIGANAKLFKVSDQGNILKHNAKDWSCVLDDQSKLVWEVKKTKKGLQSNQNTTLGLMGKQAWKMENTVAIVIKPSLAIPNLLLMH